MNEMEVLQGGGTFDCLNAVMAAGDAWAAYGKSPSNWGFFKFLALSYIASDACI